MRIDRFFVGLTVAVAFMFSTAWMARSADHADVPTTEYRAALASGFLRGGGSVVSATSTTSSVVTTAAAYTTGTRTVCAYNAGSGVVYCTIDGTSPSAANCDFALPSGVGINYTTQQLITAIQVYTASTATLYLFW